MARPGRLRGFSYSGRFTYFLTFCTSDRVQVFRDAAIVSLVSEQIVRTAGEQRFAVLEYCFMADHLHLLVRGLTAGSNLQQFAKMTKQRVTGRSNFGPGLSRAGLQSKTCPTILSPCDI